MPRHRTACSAAFGASLALAAALAGATAAVGCSAPPHTSATPTTTGPGRALATQSPQGDRGSVFVRSNVTRDDYVGSRACAACHADVTAAWERSPMHRMTRDARDTDVRAPFDGSRWRFKDDAVTLERRGDDRFIRLEPAEGTATTYRVTRIIGGRTREDFAGIAIESTSDGGTEKRDGQRGEEVVLPVSFVYATSALRYKGYSVMVHERSSLRAGPVWSRSCIFCHNTVPEMDRMLGAIASDDGRARSRPYQGELVDPLLPLDRRAHVRVTDDDAFSGAIAEEMTRLGGDWSRNRARTSPDVKQEPVGLARRAVEVVRSGFDGRALVEAGIGCEACHGGSREHAADPHVHTSFVPVAPWLDVHLAPRTRAEDASSAPALNRVCARCHQVLFSRYPFTWEGGRRDASPGGSHINSGEARDFLLGGCASAMACTACHDPHGADDREKLRALATPIGNATCTHCHSALADRDRLRAHAHHDPDGAGGACIACHMPRKNMGLDGTLTRYHRIGSPTDPARVLGDRPLECALCHTDRSVSSLADSMERWWPVRYPRQRLEELYGALDANVLRATLERGKPHEKAVAIALLGETRARAAAPAIARELLDDYPLVRQWAKASLTSILGRCDVDLSADDAVIARQAATCSGSGAPLGPTAPTTRDDRDPED